MLLSLAPVPGFEETPALNSNYCQRTPWSRQFEALGLNPE